MIMKSIFFLFLLSVDSLFGMDWGFVWLWVVGEKGVFLFFYPCFFFLFVSRAVSLIIRHNP